VSIAEALIEREAELNAVRDALAAARASAGAFVVVEGPAGIGKTALLSAADAAAADGGMARLRARATEFERHHAFGVVRQLIEALVRDMSEARRERLLSGAAAHAAPALGLVEPDARSSGFATLNGLYWLLADLAAERPLALLVDDAHWGDEPSMHFLAFLAPRMAGLPLAVIVAARAGEEGLHASVLDEIRVGAAGVNVRPAALSHAGATSLLATELGAEPQSQFAEACRAVTDGNPFLLRELAAELRRLGVPPADAEAGVVATLAPQAVAQALRVRLSRLSDAARSVAAAVAVLGDRAQLRHVASLTRISLEQAADAADELVRTAIFAAEHDGLSFAHPIVRNSVYEGIGHRMRAAMHARAARMLATEQAAPERVSPHLLLSDPAANPDVVAILRAAARNALAQGAPQIAVRLLVRALAEPPAAEREDVLYELAVAESRARSPAAVDHLRSAMSTSVDPRRRAQIALVLANELGIAGKSAEPVALLEGAIDELGDSDRQLALQLEAMLVGVARTSAATHGRMRERLRRLEAELHTDGPGERLVLANLAFQHAIEGTSAERVHELAERALTDGRLLAEVGADGMAFYFAVNALCYCDRYDAAQQHLQAAFADARKSGSLLGFALASCFRCLAELRLGMLAEAEADARAAIDAFGDADRALRAFAEAGLASALIERGELEAAELALQKIPAVADAEGQQFLVWAQHARAQLRIAQGRPHEALEDLLACGRTQLAAGLRSPSVLEWRSSAALTQLALDERDQARASAGEELELARAFGAPRAIGIALRTAGVVEGGERGIALLEEAEEPLAACEARLEHARALAARGAALRRAGRRVAAREPLGAALELTHRCGANVLQAYVRTELAAAGARPRRVMRSGVTALTPSELRVARLAAAGGSNRAIAQELFVTQKTVETHLGHVYSKLGLSSRADLPQMLTPPAA
jgi:ATP/maltotriose-dependent transcriptional regulator MalT